MAQQIADLGLVVGATGPQGEQGVEGPRGMSAFEAAVLEGYQGTEEQLYADIADVGAVRNLLSFIIGEEVPTS